MASIKEVFGKIGGFFKKVKMELKKVNWPNKQELSSYTAVVLVTVGVLIVFLGLVDAFFTRILPFL